MPPRRFLDHLGSIIDKAKLRRMAFLMELSSDETTLLLSRYCDRMSIDQVADFDNISPARQRTMVPLLEEKIQNWIVENFEFFNDRQVRAIHRWISDEFRINS